MEEEYQLQIVNELKQIRQLLEQFGKKTTAPKSEDLLNSADAMIYLKVSSRTLLTYRMKMGLPFKKLPTGKIYYWRDELDQFINTISK